MTDFLALVGMMVCFGVFAHGLGLLLAWSTRPHCRTQKEIDRDNKHLYQGRFPYK